MNREEILMKSRKENRGQDIAELEAAKDSRQLGWVIIVCLLALVSLVDAIVLGRMNSEAFFALMAATSAVFFAKYHRQGKKHELVIAVIYAAAAALFLAAWIIALTRN